MEGRESVLPLGPALLPAPAPSSAGGHSDQSDQLEDSCWAGSAGLGQVMVTVCHLRRIFWHHIGWLCPKWLRGPVACPGAPAPAPAGQGEPGPSQRSLGKGWGPGRQRGGLQRSEPLDGAKTDPQSHPKPLGLGGAAPPFSSWPYPTQPGLPLSAFVSDLSVLLWSPLAGPIR